MVVWEIGGIVAVGRIVPWPCRGGARTRRGWVVLFVELEGVLVKWLEQFQKIDFLCGC